MARTNKKIIYPTVKTHEGSPVKRINAEQELRRSVMACMLWEDQFYEDGIAIADRIADLCTKVSDDKLMQIAIQAREEQKLRHIPLFIARQMARKGSKYTADTLYRIIQRADELSEFLAMYWKEGKTPISAQVKKGLASAFTKFDEYALSKYNRDGAVKLRDVLFMCHAKPKDANQADLWKRLVNNELTIPDTWETNLSAGKDKKETFTRLINENKLGALAYLRNLRNMIQAGIESTFIAEGLKKVNASKVLPFRFISASKYAPMLEPDLESLMFKCLENHKKFEGNTILLVDVSGSMDAGISNKSDLTRIDAACALGMLIREICDNIRIFSFSNNTIEVPLRRGFALRDAINRSQNHSGTYLGEAVKHINQIGYDRLIVITDEQSHDRVIDPITDKAYMINVASYKNGVGYGKWTHIDGWSEAIVDYIQSYENLD